MLRALTATLEAVFTEWTQAGERAAAVRELGELVVELHGLNQGQPDVDVLWMRVETVLQKCLTLCGPDVPARREGFWK